MLTFLALLVVEVDDTSPYLFEAMKMYSRWHSWDGLALLSAAQGQGANVFSGITLRLAYKLGHFILAPVRRFVGASMPLYRLRQSTSS